MKTFEYKAFGKTWVFNSDDNGDEWLDGELWEDWFFDENGIAVGFIENEWGQHRTLGCLGKWEDENDDC